MFVVLKCCLSTGRVNGDDGEGLQLLNLSLTPASAVLGDNSLCRLVALLPHGARGAFRDEEPSVVAAKEERKKILRSRPYYALSRPSPTPRAFIPVERRPVWASANGDVAV